MGEPTRDPASSRAVDRLLSAYLRARQEGRRPDPQEFARMLPEPGHRRVFLELVDCVQQVEREMPLLRPCSVIAGRYELVQMLGSGGFGRVWRAADRQIGRDVAIKILSHVTATADELERYFRHELEALARLRHPGTVTVLAAGHHDGVPYIVMDLVVGRSLFDVLADLARGPQPPRTADDLRAVLPACPPGGDSLAMGSYFESVAKIAIAVLRTLAAAHALGVLHRDIKPGNIMLRGDARPVLLDFGLASLIDHASGVLTGQLLGTATYLAPEQIRTHAIGRSPRTDIYQVGLVLYELLTLAPAFSPSEEPSTLPDRVLRGIFRQPTAVRADVPQALAAICLQALAHHPERRFASADEFAAALDRWLADGSLTAAVRQPAGDETWIDPDDPERYQVLETLQCTEFELVQRARDRLLRCEVILKRAGRAILSPHTRRRLLAEARKLMRVQHPGIIRLLNVCHDGDDLVLVLEPLDGAPLAQRLRQGPMPAADSVQLLAQVCDAVAALHRHGIVHCCLGPDTVWVADDGRPRVVGFTFARELEGSSFSTIGFERVRVTAPAPAYCAPEQYGGRRPDARADVFALGCLLHHCLTGAAPDLDHDWPSKSHRRLRADLQSVLATCLQPLPQQRFATVDALSDALRACRVASA